ncbi:4271_t:CDS:2 [Ambispora leptoticha]|uniref:4271_t:CDS:1 n=1 Tax=Ambispora leptoticha TaxID=144679 RepID=A0A9N9AFU1_9GLOM|nr:4271_t:CDS:2 [Ambispora leptoticha]
MAPGTSALVVPPSSSIEKSSSLITQKGVYPKTMNVQYLSKVVTLYQKAAEALILRQYDIVHMNCLSAFTELSLIPHTDNLSPTLTTLRKKVWALYVTFVASILAEGSRINPIHPETKRLLERPVSKVVEEVWDRVCEEGYYDEEGYVDGEVIIAWWQLPKIAKDIIESWMFSIPEMVLLQLDHASTNRIKDDDPLLKTYEQIVELYVLHVLPRLKDWNYARSFLNDNNRIDEDRKKEYRELLNKLEENSKKPKPLKKKIKKKESERSNTNTKNHINGFLSGKNNNQINDAGHISSSTKLPNTMNQSTTNGRISPTTSLLADNGKNNSNNGTQLIRSSPSSTTSTSTSADVLDTQRRSTSARGIRITSPNSFGQIASVIIYFGEKMAQNFSVPRILLLCMFIVLYNGSNAKARQKISDFLNEILAKIWETIKAGTVITYV